jgi:hypothetical protein
VAPKLVLDTNAFRSLSDERLDDIAARGLRVSVSEVPFRNTTPLRGEEGRRAL